MAAKKKPVNPKGMNGKGNVVWNNPKPTAAFNKPGQKAKDLAPGAGKGIPKVTGKGNTGPFAGSGGTTASGFAGSASKGQIADAALLVVPGLAAKGLGKVATKIGSKVGGRAAEAAWNAASKGLDKSGMGGKLFTTQTPAGKSIASTVVGSPAQQAARMNNLAARAEKIATSTGKQVAKSVTRSINKGGKIAIEGTAVPATIARGRQKKSK